MLTRLTIQNYVLIDEVELHLNPGLTTITGETGSGKSILLGALGLILGDRAETDALRDQHNKCIVEANFTVDGSLRDFFELNELDFEAETIVRREIIPSGKSRAFLNDTPVTLKLLKEFGAQVIDIHSQMESSRLRERQFRFELLDAAAGQIDKAAAWQHAYKSYLTAVRQLEDLCEQEARSKADLDYFRFQLTELDEAQLDRSDWDDLAAEADLHRNAEGIAEALSRVVNTLEEGDHAHLPEFKKMLSGLEVVASVHTPSATLLERLRSAYLELKDISMEAASAADGVVRDPARLIEIEERLDGLYALQSKHRVQDLAGLRALRAELAAKVESIDSLEETIARLQAETSAKHNELTAAAEVLHEARLHAAERLSQEVKALLVQLKMPDALLHFDMERTDTLGSFGVSELRLLFTANKGMAPQVLERAASGGELSRLMLALKAVISGYRRMPTLILDEIDTGVSGDVAARMAETMQTMAESSQLIAISHLPQVAGRADHHLKVFKEVENDKTFTRLVTLSGNERVEELAGMLSGEVVTDSARDHARTLLEAH